ncbi:methyltransferase domain-containing protein [Paraburkholderia sp. JHI869]|uniref:class I SAM-dependent methyltransferase n=1 Tax=Paraburkholderia sp. JHI869 TaxID=3112959 RepID=UPI00316FFFDC
MPPPSNAVHHSAEEGYTPAAADHYVRGRPDYPPEVNAWLRETLGLGPGATVVDLGAGTGKFTRRLVETGSHVIAVEPVAAMRAKLAAALPEVDTRAGTAESLPLDDASVDAVVCAQAFHWFANAASLADILRVLKPGGRLGLIWNLRDASVEWVARLDAIVNRAEGDTPRYYTGQWRSVFPFAGFGPLHEQRFVQGHTGSPEDVIVARVKSTSFIAALPPEEQARIEAELRALIDSEPALRGQPVVTVPYGTAAFHCVKQP